MPVSFIKKNKIQVSKTKKQLEGVLKKRYAEIPRDADF